jgi:hypothetical protein
MSAAAIAAVGRRGCDLRISLNMDGAPQCSHGLHFNAAQAIASVGDGCLSEQPDSAREYSNGPGDDKENDEPQADLPAQVRQAQCALP